MENFCGYDFGYVRIYLLCMDMYEIICWLSWSCRNICAWLCKKDLEVVYGYVKHFDCGEIFGGALTFLALNFFFGM